MHEKNTVVKPVNPDVHGPKMPIVSEGYHEFNNKNNKWHKASDMQITKPKRNNFNIFFN